MQASGSTEDLSQAKALVNDGVEVTFGGRKVRVAQMPWRNQFRLASIIAKRVKPVMKDGDASVMDVIMQIAMDPDGLLHDVLDVAITWHRSDGAGPNNGLTADAMLDLQPTPEEVFGLLSTVMDQNRAGEWAEGIKGLLPNARAAAVPNTGPALAMD